MSNSQTPQDAKFSFPGCQFDAKCQGGCQVDAKWLNQVKVAFEQKITGLYWKNATKRCRPVSLKTVSINLIHLKHIL